MIYFPLAVHCVSLCLDVIDDKHFLSLSQDDIINYYSDIYQLVYERIYSEGLNHTYLTALTTAVTRKIQLLLIYHLYHPTDINPERMLCEMDDVIGSLVL